MYVIDVDLLILIVVLALCFGFFIVLGAVIASWKD